jgi:LacI family transcriptional regulator
MRSLALQLGVSKSTVSLALANNPRLPEETRLRIQAAARAAGYTQDAVMSRLLSRLRAGRAKRFQGSLAVLSCRRHAPMWDAYEVYRRFTSGIENRARELGYSTERFWLHQPGVSISALRRTLRARGIEGLAIALHDDDAPLPPEGLRLFADYPVAATQRYPFGQLAHCATINQYEAVRLACAQLARRGYRRIGLYVHPGTDRFLDGKFTAGYLYHCHSSGLPVLPVVGPGEETHAAHFRAWFRKNKPDAVVTLVSCADVWLIDLGHPPGEKVGLVHLDSTEVAGWAAVDQHFAEVGSACVDLVVGQLQRGERGVPAIPKLVTLDVGWREGPTVRPPPPG